MPKNILKTVGDIMHIAKGKFFVIVCDMCKSTLTPTRINGYQSYEGYDYSVCSNCCAKPENSTSDSSKVKFLMEFYKKSEHLTAGIPPFWPVDTTGKALSAKTIATML